MSQPTTRVIQENDVSREDQDGTPFPLEADLTGQEKLAWNVFAGWAGYVIVAATGFLAPRIMDRKLGQEALGVWDFGWSLVSYFGLTQLGVGISVNRYVATHRARGDVAGLRRMVSSATGLNLASGALTLLLTAACAWFLPEMLRADLARDLGSARWLVVLLGTSIAAQMAMQVYHGVLAGCHRFALLNAITATFEVLTALAMIGVLLVGGGLVTLGVVCLGCQLMADLTRMFWAHRACPELRVRFADADWGEAARLLRYGAKAALYLSSSLLLVQANKLTVGSAFGVAALAVFSRPLTLIRMIERLAAKSAYVLTPTASALHSGGRHEQLSLLLLTTTRLGTALALPLVLLLAILGDPILVLWMGPRYQPGASLLILSLGYFGAVALAPVTTILFGMNLLGVPAVVGLVAAAVSALLGVLNAFVLGWGLTGAALAVALPLTVSQAFLGAYACRRFDLPVATALSHVFGAPLSCAVPFALILLGSRILFDGRPLLAILVGVVLGGATILPLYWRFVIPEDIRVQMRAVPAQLWGVAARCVPGGHARGRRPTR